jgi:tellurite resistance protein TerC
MDFQHVIAWSAFLSLVLVMLGLDLFVFHRKPHAIQMKEAAIGALVPVIGAVLFAGLVFLAYEHHWLSLGLGHTGRLAKYFPSTGGDAALQYITGYIVEVSLSADNVFLFVVLLGFFRVPREQQHRVLFWGVLGALVMRGIMILLGSALLARFAWVVYVFGGFLLLTGVRFLVKGTEQEDPSRNVIVRLVRRVLPLHEGFEGKRFFTRVGGKRVATTLFLVLVCIEFTDLVFALDSIPAIFGITRDTFLVFTSNVFAILGLRSMYFLLAGVMDRFHLLRQGLAVVLGFVGVKMLLPGAGVLYGKLAGGGPREWEINEYISLGVIVAALAISIVASLIFPCKQHHGNPLDEPDGRERSGQAGAIHN